MLSKIANAKVFFNPTGNQNVINTYYNIISVIRWD